jgi:hypothetical protein
MPSPAPPDRFRSDIVERLLLAALLLAGGAVFLRHLPGPGSAIPKDFAQYWVAGRLALDGQLSGLYPVELSRGLVEARFPGTAWTATADAAGLRETSYFIYPPWVAVLYAPLALLPPWAAFALAYTLNGFLFGLAFALLPGLVPRHGRVAAAATFVVLLHAPPFLEALQSAQASVPLFLLVVLLARDLTSGRETRAGLWWALAAGLKLFPALLVLYGLARRRWRFLASGAGFGVLLAAGSVLAAGLETNLRFVRLILDHLPYGATFDSNQSVTGFLLRWTAGADPRAWTIVPVSPGLAWAARLVLLATLALTLFLVHRRARRGDRWDEAIGFSLFTLWLFVTAPNAWLHHFVVLGLPSTVAAAALLAHAGAAPRKALVAWIAAWALVLAHGAYIRLTGPGWHLPPWVALASLPLLGAWTFYALLASLLGRVPAGERSGRP